MASSPGLILTLIFGTLSVSTDLEFHGIFMLFFYQVSQSPWSRWLSVKNPALKKNQRVRGEEGCKPSKHMCSFVSND